MVQKLSFWLCAILAALVANTYAFRLSNGNERNWNKETGLNEWNPKAYQTGACVQECVKDNSLLKNEKNAHFQLGKTYRYRVRSSNEARTLFTMPVEEQRDEQKHAKEHLFGVEATVLVTPVSKCELSMQLKNVNLRFTEEEQNETDVERRVEILKKQLEQPILFGYQHGVVSDVCVDAKDESSLAVNVKKSIMSALQTTPRLTETENFKVYESDLHGKCETEYTVEKQSSHKFVVEKQKSMDKCENTEEPLEFVNWKNALLRKHQEAESRCRQVVERRELKHAKCSSARVFRAALPHVAVELASEIEIELLNVHHSDEERSMVPEQWTRHTPRLMMSMPKYYEELNFKNVERRVEIEDGRKELKQVLNHVCEDIKEHEGRVGVKSTQLVQQLHVILRDARREDVEFVWKNIVQPKTVCGEHAKKIRDMFVDTAASVMNENVVEIVRDEILKNLERKENKNAEKRVRYLATLISFASEPTPKAVRELVVPELLEKIEDAQIILSFSALVKKAQEYFVEPVYVESLWQVVLRKVVVKVQEQHKMFEIEALRLMRALENFAPKTRVAHQEQLVQLITDKRVPVAIRASGIKALQFVELENQTRFVLYKLFAERAEYNEVRVVAYLTLVHNHVTVEELKQILTVVREEEQQNVDLFNFVASHQKNLRSTEDLKKRQLLPLNAPLFPEPQSITNFWLSRSYEYTYVDEKTMLGAIVEADVVMERDSRVPRFVTFNLTVPVAEQELPIVAVTIRQEGMDKIFAQKLDTLKQFVKKAPAVIVKELIKMAREERERTMQNRDFEGKWQIFLNVDGKNVFVWDSQYLQKEQQKEMETVFAQIYRRMPIRIDETMVVMPLKHHVRLPTVSGVPVNFELNTTIVASLETELKGHQSAGHFWEMHFRPTFAVEVGVGLEADVRSHIGAEKVKRVQFVNRLYAAPSFHMKAELKPETREMRVQFMMPEQEQTLFRFETEFNNEKDSELMFEQIPEGSLVHRMIQKRTLNKRSTWFRESNKAHEQCIPAIDKMLGFTVCHQKFAVEDLKAALNTRSAKKIIYQSIYKIVKTDKDMEGWEFAVELPELYRSSKAQDELKFKLHFDTPKSAIPRRFTTELLVQLPQTEKNENKFEVKIAVASPLKKWQAGLLVINKPQQKTFKFEIFAGRQERQFLIEANTMFVQKSPKHTETKVVLRFQPRPQMQAAEFEGKLIWNFENQKKEKFQLSFQTEEKQIVFVQFIKAGHLFRPVDVMISMNGNVDFFGMKIQSHLSLNKDHQQGMIKTNGQIKYNKIFALSRHVRDQEETLNFGFQYSGFGKNVEEIKKFVHWTLESTHFPMINTELTYQIQGLFPAEVEQELKIQFGRPEEVKRIRFVHQGRYLSNVRSRDAQRHQTDLELEITPLKMHYEGSFIVDKKDQAVSFNLNVLNKMNQEKALTSNFEYAIVQREPLLMKASGEVKVGKYVFLYKDTVQEVAKNVFEGKLFIELPHHSGSKVVPKKINLRYTLAMNEEPMKRFPVVEREECPIRYEIVRFLNRFQRFEHELKVECEEHGMIRHTGLINYEQEEKIVYKAELETKNKPVYRLEFNILPVERVVRMEFQAPRLAQLKIETEIEAKKITKRFIVKLETEKYQHETRLVSDKKEQHFELFWIVRKHQETLFEMNVVRHEETLKAKIVSPVFKTELKTENFKNALVAIVKRHQTRDGLMKIVIELPKIAFETETEIRLVPQKRGLTFHTKTIKNQKQILMTQFKVLPEEKTLVVEFGASNVYRAELLKPENNVYELKCELRMQKTHLNHKATTMWRWTPAHKRDFVESFELIKFEMMNHLGDKTILDAKYNQTEEEEYKHNFVFSTRKSHVELRLPAFDERQKNVKALFTMKTKYFGGVEHQTELKNFNIAKRQLILTSTTEKNGKLIVDFVADIVLRMHEESHLKLNILKGEHTLKIDFLPMRWINVEGNFGKHWHHELKFDRKEQAKRWTLTIDTLNQRKQEKYFVRFEHQCDEFANMLIELPIVRGNVEIRLDTLKAHVELQGAKQLREWTHKGQVQWNKEKKELTVMSKTIKNERDWIVVEAELALRRPSMIKIVVEPLNTKLNVNFIQNERAEIEIVHNQWKHSALIKKIAHQPREFLIRVDSYKNEKVIVFVEARVIPTRKVQLKLESNLKRFAVTFNGKFDHEERELNAEWINKKTDRMVKVDVQLKELENVRVEFAWDAKRDTTKKIAFHMMIEKPENRSHRFVATIRGAIVFLPFEVKVDMPRNVDMWFHEYQMIKGELKNLKKQEKYTVEYERKFENDVFDAELLVKKNEFVFVKSVFKVLAHENQKKVNFVLRSDLPIDMINFEIELQRDCSYDQCQSVATAKYGAKLDKIIKFEGANVAEAIRGEFRFEKPEEQKTIKFVFSKPESKLQINIFNQAGRLLDINIDLARSIQKKFQIVSFIQSIPTINIETALGENSRVVIEITHQEEKKCELSFEWFGQWRRDFKLEVIFKFFAQPQIQIQIVSRHPAGLDEIDALLKVDNKEYAAKYTRNFDYVNKNWTTETFVKINNEKKFDVKIECQTEQKKNDREMVTYKFELEGVRRASGHLDIYLRPVVERRINEIESVEFELFNHQSKKIVGLELFYNQKHDQMTKTGMKMIAYEETVFGLVHLINEARNNKRVSLITLELPEQIQYVLRNEIQYKKYNEIESIQSELKNTKTQKPIYQTRIVFEHDMEEDMKVMKIEFLNNVEQHIQKPVIEIRYNFSPKVCKVEEHETRINGLNKCFKIEVLAGEREKMMKENKQYALRIATQYFKYPIDSRHFNRTVQFAIETVPQFENLEQQQPINFTMLAHVSKKATGFNWFNVNRHGQRQSGLVYADVEPFHTEDNMINFYFQLNGQKTTGFDMHFSPEHFFSTFTLNAKWNKDVLRRWIVGELPELHEMLHKPSKMAQLKQRVVREIREEYHHKMMHLKKNYNDELVKPIVNEWNQVQQKLVESEAQVAKIISKIYKIVVERVQKVIVRLSEETRLTYDDIMTQVVGTVEQIKRDIIHILKKNCNKNEICKKTIEQINDFEVEDLFKNNFGKNIKKTMKKIQKALPEDFEQTFKGFAKEMNSWNPENENEWTNKDDDNEEVEAVRRYYRQGARLLKMVQPEWYEGLMKHAKKIAQQVEENKPINMAEVRGQMHDIIVDMFDALERKTEKPLEKTNQYNKTQYNKNMYETETVFSPKRGEFFHKQQPIWTRA